MDLKKLIYTLNCVGKPGCNNFCSNAVGGRSKKKTEKQAKLSKCRLRYEIEQVL